MLNFVTQLFDVNHEKYHRTHTIKKSEKTVMQRAWIIWKCYLSKLKMCTIATGWWGWAFISSSQPHRVSALVDFCQKLWRPISEHVLTILIVYKVFSMVLNLARAQGPAELQFSFASNLNKMDYIHCGGKKIWKSCLKWKISLKNAQLCKRSVSSYRRMKKKTVSAGPLLIQGLNWIGKKETVC